MRQHLPHVARLLAFVGLCGALWYAHRVYGFELDPTALQDLDEAWTWPWVTAYLALWIVGNTILWPTLLGGLLYGWVGGAALSVVGATLGAIVQFLAVRTFLREPAEAWLGPRLAPLQDALERRSLGVLLMWRLLWLPVSVLTVAAALTRIPLAHHVGTIVAYVPGILALTYMADGLVQHGLWGLPAERWAVLLAALGLGVLGWWAAQHRWPALRLALGRSDQTGP